MSRPRAVVSGIEKRERRPHRGAGTGGRWFRGLAAGTAIVLAASGGALSAQAAPGDPAEAQGQFLGASLLDLQLADLAYAYASAPGGPASQSDPFDLAVLEALGLDVSVIGNGLVQVPLVTDGTGPGLLQLGEIGVVNSYAATSSTTNSVAASGAVADDGTISVSEDADPADFGNATVNLTDLLDQLGIAAVTDELIDRASLEVGALATRASRAVSGGVSSDYRVTDLKLDLSSPAVAALATQLRATLDGAEAGLTSDLEALAGPGGAVTTLVDGISDVNVLGVASVGLGDATIAVTPPDLGSLVDGLLGGPDAILYSDDNAIAVDLTNGSITVDLAELVNPGGPNLNGLDPNTSVLTPAVIAKITAGVNQALGKLVGHLTAGLAALLQTTQVTVDIDVSATLLPALGGIPVIDAPVEISGTIAEIVGGTATVDVSGLTLLPGVPTCIGVEVAGICTGVDVNDLVAALLTTVTGTLLPPVLAGLGAPLTNVLTSTAGEITTSLNGVVAALLTVLEPALDGVVANIATIVINEQPTLAPYNQPGGDLGPGSFTVRALSVTLLPNVADSDLAKLDLASSTVIAAVPAPVITSLSPDQGPQGGGTSVTITGTDLTGATAVTIGGASVPFTQVGPTEVTFTTPAHAPGPVDVTITTPGGTSAAMPFTYLPAPAITSLTPNQGPIAGGTSVTITGTDLTGATAVTIGGASVPFTPVSPTQVTFTTPAHAAGPVDVTITTPNGTSNAMPFTYLAAPAITALSPNQGPTAGGTSVTITGTDLGGATAVTIDGASVAFTQVSPTQVTFQTPPHAAGAVDVTVTTPGGTSGPMPFTYVPAPAITALTPDEGPASGGTLVTVDGTNLQNPSQVTVDGESVPFTPVSATQLTFVTPPHAVGPVDVVVTTPGGTSGALPFTYLPAPLLTALDPDAGPIAGGTPVTITGADLGGATQVTVDGVSVGFTQVSGTEITISTPPHAAGPVDVVVTTPMGTSNPLPFTYYAVPVIATLDPDEGPTSGLTLVTVDGSNLGGATALTVDGVSVPFTQVSDTQITFLTPAHAVDTVDVVVTTPGGASNAMPYEYVAAPVLTSLSPTQGTTAGGTLVTITGTDLLGTSAVTLDGTPVASFTVVDATHVTFTTPAHAAGPVPVTVTTPGGTSNPMTYTFVEPLDLLALTPDHGPETGGTVVVISGAGLATADSVTVDGVSVAVTHNPDGTITITTPPHAPGAVTVVVTNPLGSDSLPFTYDPVTKVTGVSPDEGPTGGGTTVTITGSCFTGATAVLFGGTAATGYTVVNDTTITAVVPAGTGVVDVVVTGGGTCGTGTLDDGFTYVPAPALVSLAPDHGTTLGGTVVTITGTELANATDVTIDGASVGAGNWTQVDATHVTFTTPAHAAGPVAVRVVTAGGPSGPLGYTFIEPVDLTSLAPDHGPETGGTTVVISGDGLEDATSVTVDGEEVEFTHNPDGTITFVTPAHEPGTVDVVVTNPLGSDSLPFTYDAVTKVDEVSPPSGPETGGTAVTITGSCFTGATAVLFGATPATSFTVVSDTEITAVVPAGTGVVDVSVTGGGTCGTGTIDDGYAYVPAPVAASLTPNSGPASGGTTVVVDGTNLAGATDLTVDGASVPFTQVSGTQVSFVTPPHAVGPVPVVVTTLGGSSAPLEFTYTPAAIDTVTPPSGPAAGGTQVTISGRCFTGATAVRFGSTAASSFRVVDDRTIVAVAPAGTGVVDITVVGAGSCGTATLPKAYTYLAAGIASTGVDPVPAALGGLAVLLVGAAAFAAGLRRRERRA